MAKKLNFNATDAETLAASDFVGSHLYAGGTLLSATSNALHVSDGGGSLTVDGSVTVSATDLDIRDLAAASDSVAAWLNDGSGNALSSTTGALHVSDAGGSLTVDASDLDIRDLDAASDSIASWLSDGSGNAITSTGGALDVNIASSVAVNVNDAALANTAIDNGEEEITDSATKVIASDLASRKYAFLYNNGSHEVYLGKQSGLATTNGFPLFPGVYLEARMGAAIALYGICKTGKTADVRNLQLS